MHCKFRQGLSRHYSGFVSHLFCFSSKLLWFFFPICKKRSERRITVHRKPALFSFAFAASCQAQQTHPVAARHPSRGLVKERKGAKEKIFWKLGEDARLQVCCFVRWTAEGSSRTASVRLHKGCAVQPLEKPPDGLLGAGKMLRPLLHQNLALNMVCHWLGGEEPPWQHVWCCEDCLLLTVLQWSRSAETSRCLIPTGLVPATVSLW